MDNHKVHMFLQAGFTNELYARHENNIARNNRKMLSTLTLTSALVSLVLFILSFISHTIQATQWLYLLFCVCSLALYAAVRFFKPTHNRTIYFLFYLAYTLLFSFAVIMGALLQPEYNATTICVFLVALPLLIIDRPWRITLFCFIALLTFIALLFVRTQTAVRNMDIINSISFFILGAAFTRYVLRGKVNEMQLLDQMRRQRDTDSLTQLLNRGAAEEYITRLLENVAAPSTMVIVDVDNFKKLNDTYGHTYGDSVLSSVATLLKSSLRCTDCVCRLGGDEFLLFVPDIPSEEWAKEKATYLLEAAALLPQPADARLRLSLSIGLAFSPRQGETFATLYKHADTALYIAKNQGKNQWAVFTEK